MVLWGHPLGVLGFLPSPGVAGRRCALRQRWQTTPSSLSDGFYHCFRKWLPTPRCSSLTLPTPASPTRRDMLLGGEGGVPAFMEPSLRQSEVTPRTMSQLSHLQQALWGQELGPLSLPSWGLKASPYPLQPSLLPGNPVYLTEAVRGRKAGFSCGCQPRTLLERLWFSGLW